MYNPIMTQLSSNMNDQDRSRLVLSPMAPERASQVLRVCLPLDLFTRLCRVIRVGPRIPQHLVWIRETELRRCIERAKGVEDYIGRGWEMTVE